MQLSERYRRAVLIPLDDTTESQMRCGDIATLTCVKALSIDGDPLFYAIWEAGVFAAINSACGTAIADYEEEIIEPAMLSQAVRCIRAKHTEIADPRVAEFAHNLACLLSDARASRRPVLFVL